MPINQSQVGNEMLKLNERSKLLCQQQWVVRNANSIAIFKTPITNKYYQSLSVRKHRSHGKKWGLDMWLASL